MSWLVFIFYIYMAYKNPSNKKYIFDSWTLKCHTKLLVTTLGTVSRVPCALPNIGLGTFANEK